MGLFDRLRRKAGEGGKPDVGARAADEPCRRRSERFATTVLTCLMGEVQDLSTTGMRVLARQVPPVPPGMLIEFELESPTDAVTVVGRLVRVERRKPSGYDIGIEFQKLTPDLVAALDSLARHGAIRNRKTRTDAVVTAKAEVPDLYAMLGVAANASEEELQRGFRERARQYHPDVNKSAEAQVRFVELLKAYEVLKDPEKRRAYDAAVEQRRAA